MNRAKRKRRSENDTLSIGRALPAEVAQLTDEIAAIDESIAGFKKEMKAATEIRESEKADYQATHTDYSQTCPRNPRQRA